MLNHCTLLVTAAIMLLLNHLLPSPVLAQTNDAQFTDSRGETLPLTVDTLDQIYEPLLIDSVDRTIVHLTLEECIHRALASNLDIKIGSYQPAIQMSDLIRAEAAFDAVLFSTVQADIQDRANPDSITFERIVGTPGGGTVIVDVPIMPFENSRNYQYSIGLRKRLPTGAVLEITEALQRFRNLNDVDNDLFLNPFHEFSLQLQLSQPLLRDFGIDVNRANINASRNNYRISQQQFHLLVIDTVVEVETNYWRLLLSRQRLRIFQDLFTQAKITLVKLNVRKQQDTSSEFISQTKALLERARSNIIASQNSIVDQQNRLLESLNDPNLPINRTWEILPSDRPTLLQHEFDLVSAQEIAMQYRPEILAQRLRTDTAGIAVGLAKNQTLPRFDLVLRQETTGAGDSEHSAWNKQWSNDTISYLIGFSVEVPIGNRSAVASLRRTKAEQQQQHSRLKSLQEQVYADVKIALDAVSHSYKEIGSRTAAARSEIDRLRAYEIQSIGATGTTPGFLDRKISAQEETTSALLNLAQKINDYNLALMGAQRAQGTLLRYDNIILAEQPH